MQSTVTFQVPSYFIATHHSTIGITIFHHSPIQVLEQIPTCIVTLNYQIMEFSPRENSCI